MFASNRSIFWEQGKLAFRLEITTADNPDLPAMLRAARSARQATSKEWADLVHGNAASVTVDTTAAVTETSISDAPSGPWTDVHLNTSVVKLNQFTYRLTSTGRDGSTSTTEVKFLGRELNCGPLSTGLSGGATLRVVARCAWSPIPKPSRDRPSCESTPTTESATSSTCSRSMT